MEELLEELLEEEVPEAGLLEEELPVLPRAAALTSVPVDLPPLKNLGDLEDAAFS